MAISSTNRKAGPYLGNGVTSNFPFSFKVFQTSDLLVTSIVSGAQSETVLVLNSDYSASLNADQDNNPGGSVTLTAGPLASGYRLVITSAVPELQQVNLTNLGGFYPDVINGSLDRLTILAQQLQVELDRALKFPVTDTSETVELPPAEQRAGKFLYFGADGSPSLISGSPGGTYLFAGDLLGTKDGTNKVFQLSNNGSPLGALPLQAQVWFNFPLAPNTGYTFGPQPGYITLSDQTPAPTSSDTLYAQGVFSA